MKPATASWRELPRHGGGIFPVAEYCGDRHHRHPPSASMAGERSTSTGTGSPRPEIPAPWRGACRQPRARLPAVVGHVRPEPDAFDAGAGKLSRDAIDLAGRAQQDANVAQQRSLSLDGEDPSDQCADLFLLAGEARELRRRAAEYAGIPLQAVGSLIEIVDGDAFSSHLPREPCWAAHGQTLY